jgi:hypothetical protein
LDNDDDDTDGCDNLMDYIDEDPGSSPASNALSPQVDVGCGFSSGSATFRVDFSASGAPITLSNVTVRVQDIDNSQFLTVSTPTSYSLASTTNLVVSTGTSTVTFTEPVSDGSTDLDEDHWVVMNFDSASSLTFSVGANESGSASFDFIFSATSWTSPTTTTTPTYSSTEGNATGSSPSSSPATHLDMQGRVGQQGARSPVLMEGQGLRPGSAYSLTIREPERVIQSGTTNTGGRFSHFVNLPADLQPGSYTIALSAIGINGESLVLTQSFRIGSDGKFSQIDTTVPTVKVGSGPAGVPAANEELPSTGVRSSSLPWWAIITIFGGLVLIVYSRRAVKMAEAFDARLDENGHRTPWEILSTPIRVPGIDYSPGAMDGAGSSQSLGEAVRGLDVALSLIIASQIARLRTHA